MIVFALIMIFASIALDHKSDLKIQKFTDNINLKDCSIIGNAVDKSNASTYIHNIYKCDKNE